jgi:prepilin-type N-terminal cleavage/methylation domain-containing protein
MIIAGKTQGGFTLIETIVSLVVFSVFAAMLITYMSNISKSVTPVGELQDVFALQQVMENIVSDYNSAIGSCSPSCTNSVLTNLQTNINRNVYGSYNIKTNACINLSTGSETPVNCSNPYAVLKVIIEDKTTGATLETLFTY